MSPRGEGAGARGLRPGTSDNGAPAVGQAHVGQIQRARLLAAMVAVASEHGLRDATVARVVACAGVSRRTFYEFFEDREECFLAALDEVIARASRCVLDVYDPAAKWDARVRTALIALLQFIDLERGKAQLLIAGSLGAGTKSLERRRHVLAQTIAVIDEGRTEAKAGSALPSLTAEGVVGGALSIVHAHLLDPRSGPLAELVNPLMSMIVLPYLGPAVARRELERPAPKRLPADPSGAADPLRDLGTRLTYRTVRVLLAIAAEPASSNREVGVASGVADQGQVSKLLGRLERAGLLQKTGLAPGKGAPNAWVLTEKGVVVEQAMRADVDSREWATSNDASGRSE
jgi:AcrR family transcriptional regulator